MTTTPSMRRTADQCLDDLAKALAGRGIQAVHGHGVLFARNPAGDPPDNHPQARILSPGLCQAVACRQDPDGRLWFCWVWSQARDSAGAPEIERMCPADQVGYAADRIAHVISVPA